MVEKKNETKCRKYIYDITPTKNKEETLGFLKTLDCKYHIIGYFGTADNIHAIFGFIYFNQPKTLNTVKYLLNEENVHSSRSNIETLREKCKAMGNYLEIGELQSHGKKISTNNDLMTNNIIENQEQTAINDSLIPITNILLEQNREMCTYLLKQNQFLLEENQKLKTTTGPSVVQTTINGDNIIENKKTFNIQVFLNEDCKNAITLTDFVRSLQIEDSDLMYAKDHGFTEAVAQIFERGLQNYDINTRPMHCTDMKRETMHIKDQEGWVKETGGDSKRIQKAIDTISNKKMNKLCSFLKDNPEFSNTKSPKYGEYLQFMQNVMGGSGANNVKNGKTIAKQLAKSVFVSNNNNNNNNDTFNKREEG